MTEILVRDYLVRPELHELGVELPPGIPLDPAWRESRVQMGKICAETAKLADEGSPLVDNSINRLGQVKGIEITSPSTNYHGDYSNRCGDFAFGVLGEEWPEMPLSPEVRQMWVNSPPFLQSKGFRFLQKGRQPQSFDVVMYGFFDHNNDLQVGHYALYLGGDQVWGKMGRGPQTINNIHIVGEGENGVEDEEFLCWGTHFWFLRKSPRFELLGSTANEHMFEPLR